MNKRARTSVSFLLVLPLQLISLSIFAQPVISSFSPSSGYVGTTVSIAGSNFSPVSTNNIVYFGSVKANIISSTSNSILVTVPAGATYEPISVTTNNLVAYSKLPFVLTFPAITTDFSASIFATRTDFPISGYMGSALGDFNNDGKNDLSCSISNSFGIAKNSSTLAAINFDPFQAFPTGNYPYGHAVSDFDGDGLLDIAVAKASGSSLEFIYGELSVMRNTTSAGNIALSPRIDLLANDPERSWYWIASGDLDMDGKTDIVITNNSVPGRIAIFRNTSVPGSLSFEPAVKYTTGNSPRVVSLGDINNDGKTDIVVANQGSASISIFRNLSTPGTISFAARLDFSTTGGLYPEDAALADLDLDGDIDIIVADHFFPAGTISVFRNVSSAGSILLDPRIDYSTNTADPFSIACSDLNGDGKPDLAVTNFLTHTVSIYKNASTTGAINLINQVTYSGFTSPSEPRDILAGDLNGDSKPDIIVRDAASGRVSVFQNNIISPPLPLALLDFSGKPGVKKIYLNWTTTNEQLTSHFLIEHSVNTTDFLLIGRVSSIMNSSTHKTYEFIDEDPQYGNNYYRLKMVDQDGKFVYSKIINIPLLDLNLLSISPNPASDFIIIRHPVNRSSSISIIDANGRVVRKYQIDNNAPETKLSIGGLAPGIYIISYISQEGTLSKKFIKKP